MHRKRALRIASVALALAALMAFPAAASAVTYSGTWSMTNVSAVAGTRVTRSETYRREARFIDLVSSGSRVRGGKTYRPASLSVQSVAHDASAGWYLFSPVSNAAVYHDGRLVGNVRALYRSTTLLALNNHLSGRDHVTTSVSVNYKGRIRYATYGGTVYYGTYATNRVITSLSFK